MRKWLLTSIFCVEITGTVLMLDSRKGLKKGSARKKDIPTDGYWEDDTASDIFDKDNEETEETEEEISAATSEQEETEETASPESEAAETAGTETPDTTVVDEETGATTEPEPLEVEETTQPTEETEAAPAEETGYTPGGNLTPPAGAGEAVQRQWSQ